LIKKSALLDKDEETKQDGALVLSLCKDQNGFERSKYENFEGEEKKVFRKNFMR
jgi:hypothetical protein